MVIQDLEDPKRSHAHSHQSFHCCLAGSSQHLFPAITCLACETPLRKLLVHPPLIGPLPILAPVSNMSGPA